MAGKKSAVAVAAAMAAGAEVNAEAQAAPKKVTLSARAAELFKSTPIDTEARGKAFRKTILTTLMSEFPGCSIASAAGAYNNAKTKAQQEDPKKYEMLGREPGKNNGGPKKRVVEVETAETAATETATA